MHLSALVVPIKCDANVSLAVPFAGEGVVFFQRSFEMKGVFFANVLDSEVINYQSKLHWAPFVRPQSRDKLALIVAMLVQLFFEKLVG